MPAGTADGAARAIPSLSDYVRSLWRRKLLIAAGIVLGALIGLVVLPKVVSQTSSFDATVRLEVKRTASEVAFPGTSPPTAASTSKSGGSATTPADVQLVPDITALQGTLADLGGDTKRLDVLSGVDKAQWLSVLASSMQAEAVPGTDQVDLTFADSSKILASRVVASYAKRFSARRNAADAARISKGLGALQSQADQYYADVVRFGRQADAETNPSLQKSPSQSTLAQLDLAKANYAQTIQNIQRVNNVVAFNGTPTAVLGPPTVRKGTVATGRLTLLAVGLLVGLLGGVGAALVMESIRPKVISPDDVELAAGYPVVGIIPNKGWRTSALAVAERPFSGTAEGFQRARAALERRGLAREHTVLAVLSPDRREGKSSVAANLALALARQGRGVVLVSGDLRRPGIDRLFGVEGRPGFAELLQGADADPLSLAVPVADHLLVLPAGAAVRNPAELLVSDRIRRVVQSLRAAGSIVVLDTPPARWSADALSLAEAADGIVVVVRSGASRRRSITDLTQALRRDGHRVLGIVLLGTRRGISPQRYRYGRPARSGAGAVALPPSTPNGAATAKPRERV